MMSCYPHWSVLIVLYSACSACQILQNVFPAVLIDSIYLCNCLCMRIAAYILFNPYGATTITRCMHALTPLAIATKCNFILFMCWKTKTYVTLINIFVIKEWL